MNIAILGYGKMGKVIEKIAQERGHNIVLKTNRNSQIIDLSNTDVAIEFSSPETAVSNISECFNQQTPVVSGTTGWLKDFSNVSKLCEDKNGCFLYASNFSLGVNLFFELNKNLSKLMNKFQ